MGSRDFLLLSFMFYSLVGNACCDGFLVLVFVWIGVVSLILNLVRVVYVYCLPCLSCVFVRGLLSAVLLLSFVDSLCAIVLIVVLSIDDFGWFCLAFILCRWVFVFGVLLGSCADCLV